MDLEFRVLVCSRRDAVMQIMVRIVFVVLFVFVLIDFNLEIARGY